MGIRVGLIDPSLMDNEGGVSPNAGDQIIFRAISREIRNIFGEYARVERVASHRAPGRNEIRRLSDCDLTFVGGSNLLWFRPFPPASWHFGWRGLAGGYRNLILLGVGWGGYEFPPNIYGRWISRILLAESQAHSVRDGFTQSILRDKFGFKTVINTACPTMWELTDQHLSEVPRLCGDACLFTLTDYSIDPVRDQEMIRTIHDVYNGRLLFFPQGKGDLSYCKSLGYRGEVFSGDIGELISQVLGKSGLDYVGTRLHCGILCLEHKMRTTVISVDNRAREIGRDTGLPVLERAEMNQLGDILRGPVIFSSKIPWADIMAWRSSMRGLLGGRNV